MTEAAVGWRQRRSSAEGADGGTGVGGDDGGNRGQEDALGTPVELGASSAGAADVRNWVCVERARRRRRLHGGDESAN